MNDLPQKKTLRKREAKRAIDNVYTDHGDSKKSSKSKKKRPLKQQKLENETAQGMLFTSDLYVISRSIERFIAHA